MSTTYVLIPSPAPSGNNDNGPDASSDAFTDDVPRTTVTITSFYTAESTSASSSSGSGANSSTSPGSRKFAALAVGGALGGFALTCLLGWALIWWWRKRRMAGPDGEVGSVPVLGIGALRTDAENFPGWRRTVASRLQETDGGSQTSAADINERRSSSYASPSLGGRLFTHMEEVRPNFVTRPPGSKVPLLPLPPTASSDLTRECTKAFSKVGRSRGSVSSKSSSSLGGGDKSTRSPPLGPSNLAFLQEQRSEEGGSGTADHSAVAGVSRAPGLTNSSAQRVNDLASQSSHASSQFYSPSAATHPPPATFHAGQPHYYYPGNPTLPPRPARTPSPTQHRRNSASSQASASAFGIASPSSWHGHTSTPQRPGHASWHGPSLAMHWSGHLPHFGRGDGGAAVGPTAAGPNGPPSSWAGHFHPSHHHTRSLSGSGFSVPSSQQPLLSNHTSNGSGSSGLAPATPPNAWLPPQPKFFFQPPSAAGSRAPSPPPPSPPPSPLDPPPTGMRLTVTNPDLNSSPATSSLNLSEDEKPPPKPSGSTTPLGKSPLSQ
ncbi:hypothetical protein M407DRAFT_16856 [Tulasnella calospora MUT 4182]|uniref:Uncharacterized protein n=1 Tax=Tulasnella calospora MUT 4182 TaxID=1051891 RepID=A0A0C3QWR2_9AGAM|nr:hypothetical protein M407DRAFT_16856 [Tulasnella calospora MUT 4182]